MNIMYTKTHGNWNGAVNCADEGEKMKNEWDDLKHWSRSNWNRKSVRDFSVRGWPAVLLVIIAIAVLSGPILGLTFFLLRVAFSLLPILLIAGLAMFGMRYAMRHGHGGGHWGRWDDREKWKEYGAARWAKWKHMARDWEAEWDNDKAKTDAKPKYDAKRKNDDSDVVYM